MRPLLVSKDMWTVTDPTLEEDGESDSKQKKQAIALIILALGEEQMVHVENSKTARDAWRKLKSTYTEPSAANRMLLHEKLLTSRQQDGDDARQRVHELAKTRTQLCVVGVVIHDTLYKPALLHRLSTRFENLWVALEA